MNKENKYLLIYTFDINDADYITRQAWLTIDQLEKVVPILSAIMRNDGKLYYEYDEYTNDVFKSHYGEDSEETLEDFRIYFYFGEYGSGHTLKEFKVYDVKEIEVC